MTDDDDHLAAEYVLGTLDGDARRAAAARALREPAFANLIRLWEERMAPLNENSPEAQPSQDFWPAIASRLDASVLSHSAQVTDLSVARLRRHLAAWRIGAVASAAIAACLALWVGYREAPGSRPVMVAVLQKSDTDTGFLVRASSGDSHFSVQAVSAPPLPGKSYELWVINPEQPAPSSLGVLNPDGVASRTLPPIARSDIAKVLFAVTVEQAGGSPTGAPTSKPVFTGRLLDFQEGR